MAYVVRSTRQHIFQAEKWHKLLDWYHRKHSECKTALVDALTTISTAPISPFHRQKIRILNFKKSSSVKMKLN